MHRRTTMYPTTVQCTETVVLIHFCIIYLLYFTIFCVSDLFLVKRGRQNSKKTASHQQLHTSLQPRQVLICFTFTTLYLRKYDKILIIIIFQLNAVERMVRARSITVKRWLSSITSWPLLMINCSKVRNWTTADEEVEWSVVTLLPRKC